MTTPVIDNPPTPPTRSDPANFAVRGDSFLGWFPTFVTQINSAITWIADALTQILAAVATVAGSPLTQATSTTSLSISVGSKTLTIETGKSIVTSMWVAITSTADGNKWMAGPVLSYNSSTGQLVVDVQRTGSSGTIAAWTIVSTAPLLPDTAPRALAGASTIKDPDGIDHLIGYRGAPAKPFTAPHQITPDDNGRTLELGAGSSITIPTAASLMGIDAGDIILLQETGGATRTITPDSGVTLRQCGTTNTGPRTLKANGQAMLRYATAGNVWYCSGDLT